MIPNELKQLKQWCIWRYVKRGEKWTKLPVNPTDNTLAKSNDESTWADLQTAREGYQTYQADGLGFFFKEPYIGIDIDDIADDLDRYQRGDIQENMIVEFYESLKSYAEISPSGNGIHIIAKGKIPGSKRRKNNVEMYDSGRFFTMTGDSLGKYETINEPNSTTIERLYKKYIGEKNVVRMPVNNHGLTHDLSESEIISQIMQSKQADAFKQFMNDDWHDQYDSQSEADLAFANLLAFWCARDYGKMDSLFRQSSLMRSKWDEKRGKATYGEATLYKAINETEDVYTPSHKQEPLNYIFNFTNQDQTKKEFPNRSWDDTGNAQRVLDRYGDIIRYSYIAKKFYVYNGEKWEVDQTGQIRQLIDAMIEDMKNEKIIVGEDVDEDEAMKKWRSHITKSRSNASKKNIQDELKHQVAILPEAFDQHNMLLNAKNGYVDLTGGTLHNHDKKKLFSKQASVDFTEKMQADTWVDFLNDIFAEDQELIRYLQKALGYSLTGSTKEQVMFILHGKGRNGKSIFVETISDILGDYTKNIRANSLMVKRNEGVNNDIAALQSARFVTSSEPNEGFRFDEGLIKQLTGGDKVTARFLYGEDFEFTPKFKLWVTTNHKPIIRGTDDGIWRRLMLIPFDVQIPEHKVDKDLKWKLLREAPAILDWMIEGARLWQKHGLNPPQKILEASKAYRNEMDVLEHFIADECQRGDDYRASSSELYDTYKQWAEDSGEFKMNKNTFGKKMKEKFKPVKSYGRIYYQGIRIKEFYPGLRNMK